jgi:hypothetical protein
VQIENVSHWNMNSKRMEAQARWGDILITLGGGEGVLFLANLYHDAGKPVVPLNLPICPPDTAPRHDAWAFPRARATAVRCRRPQRAHLDQPHHFSAREPVAKRVTAILELLEALDPPRAFVVRLLNPTHEDFADVEAFFATVVQSIVEGEPQLPLAETSVQFFRTPAD